MYDGEPITVPTCVSVDDSMRAIPKSATFTVPSTSKIMFEGLMSRCTTPCLSEQSRASNNSDTMRVIAAIGKRSAALEKATKFAAFD